MKNLSKEKRTQLVGVAALSLLAVAGLWFGLINAQQHTLAALATKKGDALRKYQQVQGTISRAQQVEAELAQRSRTLAESETGMASGDIYSWAINTLRAFKANYKIEIPQFSQIDGPRDSNLLPNFPYKQASISVAGSGGFYEFGRFIADLENAYPSIRLANLTLEPVGSMPGVDPEKLAFKFDVIALVKPN